MYLAGLILIVVALIGALGATFLFPLLALVFGRNRLESDNALLKSSRLAVFIPVVDELELLSKTVTSLQNAIAKSANLGCEIRLFVCFDGSLPAAPLDFPMKNVVIHSDDIFRGKWGNLKDAILSAGPHDWSILCDVGSVVPEDFFRELTPYLSNSNLLGLAPGYRPAVNPCKFWVLERLLKSIENLSGGPISVHGATVIYNTRYLKPLLQSLSGDWLNDDVVLPLMLRSNYPNKKLIYLHKLQVKDLGGLNQEKVENKLTRRLRVSRGNLEWIKKLLPTVFRTSPKVGVLALRRVFRLFWGYWALFGLIGAVVVWPNILFPLIITWLVAILLPEMRSSFYASLLSPFELLLSNQERKGAWS